MTGEDRLRELLADLDYRERLLLALGLGLAMVDLAAGALERVGMSETAAALRLCLPEDWSADLH